MEKENKGLGASASPTACSPSGSSPVPGLAADALRPTGAGITPGPWVAEPADIFGDHNIIRGDGEDALAIAAVVSNMRVANEVEANARLIAAAPDLYEALKGLMPTNLGSLPATMPDSATLPLDVTFGELRKAIAALLKAEGR